MIMILIPESVCLTNQLNETLKGKIFIAAESHGSWIVMDFDDDSYLCASIQMYGGSFPCQDDRVHEEITESDKIFIGQPKRVA
jgi:hypothetical protein